MTDCLNSGIPGFRCKSLRNRPAIAVRVAAIAGQLGAHNRAHSRWSERIEQRRTEELFPLPALARVSATLDPNVTDRKRTV